MTSSQELINTLILKIKNLPENRIKQVIDFVNFLYLNEINLYSTSESKGEIKLHQDKNVLMKFIGGVNNGSLAKDIDKDLYGR
jgi:hypothetical protein